MDDLRFELHCRMLSFRKKHYPVSTYSLDSKKLNESIIHWPIEYQWQKADKWVSHLLTGFKKYVKVRFEKTSQDYHGMVVIGVSNENNKFFVAIDYSDDSEKIDRDCLEKCKIYFKMQYLSGGYNTNKIKPGLYVPNGLGIYRYLPYLRGITKKKYDVYGRFGLEFAGDIRKKAVNMLKRQKLFKYEGQLAIIRYSRYLRDVAASKICIDLPGNGDFCFRLIDYLAVGVCIIGPPHKTILSPLLQDRKHMVFCKPDLSDLVDLCSYYLDKEEEREQIARNSKEYFDKYLHKDQLAAFYLSHMLE